MTERMPPHASQPMSKDDPGYRRARDSALRLLRVRPRSVAELRQRLSRKGFNPLLVEEVLAFLRRLGYLDDLSFARAWVRGRMNSRPRSRRLLMRELRQKGVDEETIAQAVDAVGEDAEAESCRMLAEKRARQLKDVSPERARLRIAAFLKRRGYRTAHIMNALQDTHGYEEL